MPTKTTPRPRSGSSTTKRKTPTKRKKVSSKTLADSRAGLSHSVSLKTQTGVSLGVSSALLIMIMLVASSTIAGLFLFGALRGAVKTPVSLQVETVATTSEYQNVSVSEDKKVLKMVFHPKGKKMTVQQVFFTLSGLQVGDVLQAELVEGGSNKVVAQTKTFEGNSLTFK